MYTLVLCDTRIGKIGLLGSSVGLKKLLLPEDVLNYHVDPTQIQHIFTEENNSTCLGDLPLRLKNYLNGEYIRFFDALDLEGATDFQKKVWLKTRSISYGETRSYAFLSKEIGSTRGARAVGQALSKNPVPIIVPCHRIITSNGGLGGFSAGLSLKKFLLRLEGSI